MTTTSPSHPLPTLTEDVRAVHNLPDLPERRRIRLASRLSLARLGQEVGVTGTAIWQWETRVRRLPVTEKSVRYARLLADLAQLACGSEDKAA